MDCYRMEEYNYEKGLLEVDATYIIHLEGNGRLPQVEAQLEKYHPSRKVYIVYNKGYTCKKNINTSRADLVDAFLTTFRHANKKNYKNVLVLEDDFQFHPDIKRSSIQEEINLFINKRKEENLIYYLGAIPIIRMPGTHSRLLLAGCSHACIYTESCRKRALHDTITDMDKYNNIHFNRYAYYKPLCYQLFPETENSKIWRSGTGIIMDIIIRLLKLDTQVEPGYKITYVFSLLFFYTLLLGVLYIIQRML